MDATTRELIVMRHAKAEPFAPTDHERVLAERGILDAAAAGAWAQERGYVPDLALVSSAARTQGTWAAFQDGCGCTADAWVDRSLYSAGADAALEIIRAAPDAAQRVIVVGHNPTMAYLVQLLDDGEADPVLFNQLSEGYPTSALSVLRIDGPWSSIQVAGARLTDFHVGRG